MKLFRLLCFSQLTLTFFSIKRPCFYPTYTDDTVRERSYIYDAGYGSYIGKLFQIDIRVPVPSVDR